MENSDTPVLAPPALAVPATPAHSAATPAVSAPAPSGSGAGQLASLPGQGPSSSSINSLYFGGDLLQPAAGTSAPQPDAFSSNPVRYADGVVALSFTDLPSDNSGLPTGVTRSWTNGSNYSTGLYGSGMVFTQLPHLVQGSGDTLEAIHNGTTVRYLCHLA